MRAKPKTASKAKSPRERARTYRERMKKKGMRLVHKWVVDRQSPKFKAELRRQAGNLADASDDEEVMQFIENNSVSWDRSKLARGDIVTAATGGDYGNKPRPAVIVQADIFPDRASVTVCPLTSVGVDSSFVRPQIEPTAANGLREVSWMMTDKITTIRAAKLGRRIGQLSAADMARLEDAIAIFLGPPE
jgi:mRNA interferase MazF